MWSGIMYAAVYMMDFGNHWCLIWIVFMGWVDLGNGSLFLFWTLLVICYLFEYLRFVMLLDLWIEITLRMQAGICKLVSLFQQVNKLEHLRDMLGFDYFRREYLQMHED